MASPPPDNGLTTARGSVALPRGRKTTATLRISELYANEGKVSIGGKAFKTLAIKVRGDRFVPRMFPLSNDDPMQRRRGGKSLLSLWWWLELRVWSHTVQLTRSASLHQTVTVELFEATKKGRSGLPLHTFRIKHCTGLERWVVSLAFIATVQREVCIP